MLALLLVASACSSGAGTTTPATTAVSTTTLAPTTTQVPTTTTTPPTTTLQFDVQEYMNQLFAAGVGKECGYLFRSDLKQLVGIDETAVRTKVEWCGGVFRVVHRDGENLIYTADLNDYRINAAIVDGVVAWVFKS